ncbi:hypothetical protein [Veronia pacifica]|uniref:Uncharacterized protein n=1 Tax=Veronia pacifica TaxID=1080227 RepID=A0A1C3EQT6_9GAMM|nr:hypothetical protein [Veronia pacifica]ODA35608.1 hypothetical protein A8L45_03020 [Veronia pacifica]
MSNLMVAYPEMESLHRTVDALVIGAGLSGLYSAWRLLKSNPELSVAVVAVNRDEELTDVDVFQNSETVDLNVDRIIRQFGRLTTGQPCLSAKIEKSNVYEKSRQWANIHPGCKIWSESFYLRPQERSLTPQAMISQLFSQIIQKNPGFGAYSMTSGDDFWQKFNEKCEWKGRAIEGWSLWELLSDIGYSDESITLLCHASGFNSAFIASVSAGVAYQLLQEFPSEYPIATLVDGLSTLSRTLIQEIGREKIIESTVFHSLERNIEYGQYPLTLCFSDSNKLKEKKKIYTKSVIIGIKNKELDLFLKC